MRDLIVTTSIFLAGFSQKKQKSSAVQETIASLSLVQVPTLADEAKLTAIHHSLVGYLDSKGQTFEKASKALSQMVGEKGLAVSLSLHQASLFAIEALSLLKSVEQEAMIDRAINELVQVLALNSVEAYLSDRDVFALVAVLMNARDAFNRMVVADYVAQLNTSEAICADAKAYLIAAT